MFKIKKISENVATIYLQDANTKIWEETFDSKNLAEMALDSKLESLFEDDGYDYPYSYEIEEV